MKKIISLCLITILGFSFIIEQAIAADSMPGESAVKECFEKAKKLLGGEGGTEIKSIGSISNPIDSRRTLACTGKNAQDYLYHAIVDVLFSEIDMKIEKYLKTLEGTKEPMTAIDDLQKKFGTSGEEGSFQKSYHSICYKKTFEYSIQIASDGGDKLSTSNQAFSQNCEVLYKLKLQSYYDAGTVIVARETEKTYRTEKKKFMTKIKDKYRDLLFKFTVYLGQLKVINAKFYTNTKKPSN